jgi:hypothetical protein
MYRREKRMRENFDKRIEERGLFGRPRRRKDHNFKTKFKQEF